MSLTIAAVATAVAVATTAKLGVLALHPLNLSDVRHITLLFIQRADAFCASFSDCVLISVQLLFIKACVYTRSDSTNVNCTITTLAWTTN
jgi:hypothetical protein